MGKRVRQGCAGATMHTRQPTEVAAGPTEGGKSFADRVENLKSDDVMIAFGPSVQKHFGRLYDLLADRDDFDSEGDTLAHIEDLSGPGQHYLPIAFTMVAEVMKDVTAYAQTHTAYTPRLTTILNELKSDLSGFGAEREPIQIKRISRNR
jgi:hypothetical protein